VRRDMKTDASHGSVKILNKHSMGCEAQLTWKCLFTSSFFDGRLWPVK